MKLDVGYTKMLRVVENVSWHQRMIYQMLDGDLPKLMTTTERRVLFSENCWKSKIKINQQALLWELTQGNLFSLTN